MIYPWQNDEWQQLISMHKYDRLPHAIMFVGLKGIGKAHLASEFGKFLLCASPSENACGECHSCRIVSGRTHQNILWVEPEKVGSAIKVDQVREINEFISQSAMQGDYKIAIISPANKMNANAANALLKTLEEPSEGAIIVLCCDQLGRLPATITSRCHRLSFNSPNLSLVTPWLSERVNNSSVSTELLLTLANGSPLGAIELEESGALIIRSTLLDGLLGLSDPLSLAAKLQKEDLGLVLGFMQSFLIDILKLQLSGASDLVHADYHEKMIGVANQLAKPVTALLSDVEHARVAVLAGIHLNKQVSLESLFIKWVENMKVAA